MAAVTATAPVPVTMAQLPAVLEATLLPDNVMRPAAERALNQLQRQPGYLSAVLQLTSPSVPKPMIRLAAATSLRNAFVTSRNWDRPPQAVEDENHAHFSEADKEAVRGTIIEAAMALVQKPMISTVADAIVEMAAFDFPTKWPSLLTSITENLKRTGELNRVHNILLIVRKIAKRFEYYGRNRWGPMETIINAISPSLYQMMEALLGNPSVQSAVLVKLILKIFWSTTCHNFPAMLRDKTVATQWFRLLNSVLAKQLYEPGEGKEPCQPANLDDREAWPWWKAKKWAAQIFQRMASKYCSIAMFGKDNPEERKFCRLFSREIMVHLIPTHLQLLYSRKNGKFLTKKVLVCLLQFLSACSETERTFKVLRGDGHLAFLLCEVVPALCAFNDEDQELWISEPEEFVRRGYQWTQSQLDPRVGAINVLVDFVRNYRKACLKVLWPFWGQHLEAYRTGAALNHRLKAGIMTMIESVQAELKSNKLYRSKLEAILKAYVLPDFTPPAEAPYLQARACEVFSQFADIPYKEPAVIAAAAKHMINCLNPSAPLPVQFQAATSFVDLLEADNEHVFAVVEENVGNIVTNLLRLMGALAIDDVVKALDHLIIRFGVHMLEFLHPLAVRLVELYRKNVSAEDEEDNDEMDGMGMMAAENCVSTLATLVQITTLKRSLYPALETTVMPLLAEIFNVEEEDVNMMPLGCNLLQTLAFHSPVPFSENLWRAFVAMYKAYDGFGFDFLRDCVGCTENFITRDKARFLAGNPATGDNYLSLVWHIVAKPLQHGNEDDVAVGVKLVCRLLLTHPGHVDMLIDMAVSKILVPHWLTKPTKNGTLKVMLANVFDACLLYNAKLTLASLERYGALQAVLAGWYAALPEIVTDVSNKLAGCGICAALRLGPAALPAVMRSSLSSVLAAAIQRLRKVHPNEEEDTDDEDASDEDEDDDEASDVEADDKVAEESDDEAVAPPTTAEQAEYEASFDEAAAKARKRFVTMAKQAEAEHKAFEEGGGDDDDDDDEDSDEEEDDDATYATPFDHINELIYFADTMKVYGTIPEGAAMHGALPPELQKTCARLLGEAESQRAELLAEVAAAGGGTAAIAAASGAMFAPGAKAPLTPGSPATGAGAGVGAGTGAGAGAM